MQATTLTAKVRCLAMAAALSLLLNSGLAQAADSPASDTTKSKADDEVVQLSPFVVDSSKDQGYRATSTLAGSRINTDLKDVAASITVVTKEFLSDINAVGINDILSYTANTEGTHDFTNAPSSLGRPSDGVSANPQGSNRIRGLSNADITRDYFYTIGQTVGFDAYNLDEVTINRGPNSVLAGLGSPAGIINYSPQLANTSQDKSEISYRFGSFKDQRATFNSNIVALKDIFAIRVAGAWSDQGFKQQPAWNKDKRLYAALTYQPWKKTTLRASFEQVKVDSNNPNSITPEDDVSQWVALGKPSYNKNTGVIGAGLFNDANGPLVVYNSDGTRATAYNPGTNYVFNQGNLNNVGIWTPLRMNNDNYLPLQDLNLSPSDNVSKLQTVTLSLDQEILPNLNLNLSYLHEKFDDSGLNLFRAEYANYLVDVNQTTVTGAPNPHYGETYMQFRGLDNLQSDNNTNRVARATLNYDLDLTKYNKWLGRYRLTGFVEDRKTESDHLQSNTKSSDAGPNYLQEVSTRYYLGGSATSPATTTPTQPSLVSGIPYLNANGSTGTLDDFYWLKSNQKSLTKLGTQAFVAQGYLLDDRIVGLFGIRKDKNQAAFASVVDPGDVNSSGFLNPIGPYPDFSTVTGQTKTYGVVVHPLKWLSFHYNHAQNFVPNAGSEELNGAVTPPPQGLGKDYGVSVSLFNDKLNIKLNWFELTSANNPSADANFPVAQWTLPFQELIVEPALAAAAGVTYKKAMADGLIVGDPRLSNAYTAATVSKGLELEMTYNVTKNWRIMANVSKQQAVESNIAPNLTAFINERLAYWQSIPALWSTKYSSSALPATQWGGQPDGTVSGQGMWNEFSNSYFIGYKSADGKPNPQVRKWHANVLSNYQFTDGMLKGWNFGGAARYLDKAVIGNPAIYQIVNGVNTLTGLDVDHPYYASGYVALDAWVGYTMKVYHDKYVLNFQLNGKDLQESGGFRPILANSDGTHSVYRIVQPRTFYLTTKLDF